MFPSDKECQGATHLSVQLSFEWLLFASPVQWHMQGMEVSRCRQTCLISLGLSANVTPTLLCFQVIGERQGATYLSMKLKDQARSLDILRNDPALSGLERLEAPYLDLEVRGLPALTYFGQQLWGPKLEAWSKGGQCLVAGLRV